MYSYIYIFDPVLDLVNVALRDVLRVLVVCCWYGRYQ